MPLTKTLKNQVLLLFDCDTEKAPMEKGKLVQRSIPMQSQNSIKKGIENLFTKSTLELARQDNPALFGTEEEHGGTDEHGQAITIPEQWFINRNQKKNLANWLCKNGTEADFQGFGVVFELLEEALNSDSVVSSDAGGHEQLQSSVLQANGAVANPKESK